MHHKLPRKNTWSNTAAAAWTLKEVDLYITILKTRVVLLSLSAFQDHLIGHSLVFVVDMLKEAKEDTFSSVVPSDSTGFA